MTLIQLFTNIANAIRAKTGSSETIKAENFPTEIADITTGHLDNTEYQEANDDLDNILEGSTPTKVFPPDWSEIGYEDTPQSIIDGFNYAKEIYDNWDSSITDMQGKYSGNLQLKFFPNVNTSDVTTLNSTFSSCELLEKIGKINTNNVTNMYNTFMGCKSLKIVPLFNTSLVTDMDRMLYNCNKLTTIPEFDTSSVKSMTNMFSSCTKLTDESLNNILAMCTKANKYTQTKTLKQIGLTEVQATTCQSLSNYQAFLDVGWTTGY